MTCSLDSHARKYNVSLADGLLSALTGLSGLPYAIRHWSLSQTGNPSCVWGHRCVALLEATPILGAIAGLLERTVIYTYTHCSNTPQKDLTPPLKKWCHIDEEKAAASSSQRSLPPFWRSQAIAPDMAMRKMLKNFRKAIEEHKIKDPSAYVSFQDDLLPSEIRIDPQPLRIIYFEAESQGPRPTMEDAHFLKEFDQGFISGILDGHGGSGVAQYVSERIQELFSSALKMLNGDVFQTFETVIHAIHEEVSEKGEWNCTGCTAVICFIEKKTRLIFTATLGDSEANIYRRMNDSLQSIPLSCVRDWKSTKDAQRAASAIEEPEIALRWPKAPNPKALRFPNEFGLNISRSIGDADLCGTREKPGVIHKPKISMTQLQFGDIIILASDGLKDYVSESEIIIKLKEAPLDQNPAQFLLDYSIKQKQSRDNVSILVIRAATQCPISIL